MIAAGGKIERVEQLLTTRAVEGLDSADSLELEGLLGELEGVDPTRFDEAAAAAWLAGFPPEAETPLPADVRARVEAHLSGLSGEQSAPAEPIGPERRAPSSDAAATGRGSSGWGWVAAAAALVLAVAGWWPQLFDRPEDEPFALAEARDRLLQEAPDAVRIEWEAMDHPLAQGVTGHVVWSESAQRGYMTFRDLPENDPAEQQYQLWVFDAERDEQYPVDGGVFDAPVEADEEVVVPIRSQLTVRQAEMFAVTLEEAGGVVVSERDAVLWVAQHDEADVNDAESI